MATDLYKTVNFNDGEGITHGDLANSQKFLGAKLGEQILEKLVCLPVTDVNTDAESESRLGANISTAWCYALTASGAHFRPKTPGAGAPYNTITVQPGTVFQKVGTSDGNESTILAYTFPGTDTYTVADGHATLPRVDILQMKLEYDDLDPESRDFKDATTGVITSSSIDKTRRVKATVNWKTGTAAATPAYPTPDAGYVPLCAVVIDNAFNGSVSWAWTDVNLHASGTANAGNAGAVIHDLRIPVNTHTALGIYDTNGAQWARKAAPIPGYESTANTGAHPTNKLYNKCPYQKGRLMGLKIEVSGTGAGTDEATISTIIPAGTGFNGEYCDMSAYVYGGGASPATYNVPATAFEVQTAAYFDSFMSPLTVTGNGTHRPPLWCNGARGYYDQEWASANSLMNDYFHQLALTIVPLGAGDRTYYNITWIVAQGL